VDPLFGGGPNVILNLVLRMFAQDENETQETDLTKADQDILKNFEAEILKSASNKGTIK